MQLHRVVQEVAHPILHFIALNVIVINKVSQPIGFVLVLVIQRLRRHRFRGA